MTAPEPIVISRKDESVYIPNASNNTSTTQIRDRINQGPVKIYAQNYLQALAE